MSVKPRSASYAEGLGAPRLERLIRLGVSSPVQNEASGAAASAGVQRNSERRSSVMSAYPLVRKDSVLRHDYKSDVNAESQKKDKRTVEDLLTDYLLFRAGKFDEDASPWDYVYDEGMGAKEGCDRNYWLQREEEETVMKCEHVVWRTPDNTVFRHMNKNVKRFFELGGYRAFPDIVTIQVEIREIFWVNVARGTFRVAFILQTRWYDKSFDTYAYKDKVGTEVTAHTIPYVTFDHCDEGDSPVGVPADAAGLDSSSKHSGKVILQKAGDPPGVLYHSSRIQATFMCQFNVTDFPFDTQQLKLNLRLWGSNVPDDVDYGRVLIPIDVKVNLAHELLDWQTFQAMAMPLRPRGDRQDLEITIHVARKWGFFVKNVFLVIASISTLSFCSFGVPMKYSAPSDIDVQYDDAILSGDGFLDGFEARCQITLSLLLTLIAYKFYLADMLPQAPYLSFLDRYIRASFFMVALVFVGNTAVLFSESSLFDPGLDHTTSLTNTTSADGQELASPKYLEHRDAMVMLDFCVAVVLFATWIIYNIWMGCSAWLLYDKRRKQFRVNYAKKGKGKLSMRVYSDQEKSHRADSLCVVHNWNKKAKVDTLINDINDHKKKYRKDMVAYHDDEMPRNDTLLLRRQLALSKLKDKAKRFWATLDKRGDDDYKVWDKISITTLSIEQRDNIIEDKKKQIEKHSKFKPRGHRRGELGTGTAPNPALESFLRKAGLRQQARALAIEFATGNMTLNDLHRIFNDGKGSGVVLEVLRMIGVDESAQFKIVAELAGPIKLLRPAKGDTTHVIALQGSASYLMEGLELQGKLVPRIDVLNVLETELERKAKSCTERVENRVKVQDKEQVEPVERLDSITCIKVQDIANYIYASTLLQSPAISHPKATQKIFSLRNFQAGPKDSGELLYSQVWLGYLARVPKKQWKPEHNSRGGALAIDFGTGEMKFGYAERSWNETEHKLSMSDGGVERFPTMKTPVDMQKVKYDMADVNIFRNTADKDSLFETALKHLNVRENLHVSEDEFGKIKPGPITSVVMEKLVKPIMDGIKQATDVLKEKGRYDPKMPIFMFGTAKVRERIQKHEADYGAQASELLDAMVAFISFKYKKNHRHKTDPMHKCHMSIMEQEDEARCEHIAFQICVKQAHEGSITKELRNDIEAYMSQQDDRGCRYGNVAWGNGSTQGIISRIDGVDVELKTPIGLNKVGKIVVEELKGASMKVEFTDKKGFAGKGKEDGFRVVAMAPEAAAIEVEKVWVAVRLQLMRLMKKECPEVPLDETKFGEAEGNGGCPKNRQKKGDVLD